MAGVALSSLRVTTDMDSSGYTQGMAAKVAADQAGVQSADSLGQALARTDAALDKVVPGTARLSKGLLDGYGAASTFERTIRSIGDAVDRGLGLDRANVLLDAAYRKFGLVADAAVLAKQGFVSLTPSIDSLNQHYSIQAEIIDRATQATQRQTQAMAAQAEYNARLGVSDYKPGAAQSSADAFMAPFGGLEGVAKTKAEQIGKSFQQSLTQSFGIDAPTKSAREAAATFQEQFDQLDTLTKQRGEQMGSNFQKSLNESFGIGGPSATSQGATYSALDEMMKQQDAIQKARSEQNAQGAQQGINDAFGIGAQVKSAKDSASVFDQVLKQEEDMDKAAQRLRDSLNPLAASQKLYNDTLATYQKLADAGKISSDELAAGNDMAAKQLAATAKEATGFGTASIFGSTQGMALTAALRHMFDAFEAGRPPMQALMMELGNLQYGLSGSGGFMGSLQNVGKWIMGFITPLSVATVAVGAFGAAAVAAAFKWEQAQLDIARSLTGVGRAAGATVEDINRIADASSKTGDLSISEARNVAMALAQTGNVTKQEFEPIIDVTKNLAATLGVNVAEATKTLAAAFEDPVKGADDLNKRLGFLDDATKTLITSLANQGDRMGANKALLDAMIPSLGKATDLTNGWARAWDTVSNAVSNAFTKLGQTTDKMLFGPAGGALQGQIDSTQKQLDAAQNRLSTGRFEGQLGPKRYQDAADAVAKLTAQLDRLKQKQSEVDAQAAAGAQDQDRNKLSERVSGLINQASPKSATTDAMKDSVAALNKAMADPAMAGYIKNIDDLPEALERWKSASDSVVDSVSKTIDLQRQQLRAVDNRTPADRADIAMAQKKLELAGSLATAEEKATQIQLAGAIASGGQTAADQNIIQRINLLGNLATVQDKVNAKRLELVNANRDGAGLSKSDIDAITHMTQVQEEQARLQERVQVGVAKESEIRKKMDDDTIAFLSRQKSFPLSDDDKSSFLVTQEKRIEKMIDTSKTASAQLEGLKKLEIDSGGSAGGFRNLVDSTSVSSLNSVASGLADITTGSKTAKAGFADMGATIVRALEEMLIKITIILPLAKALQGALGGFFGGGAGGGGGGGIPLPGLTGGFHSGGTTSEPSFLRFVAPGTFDLAPRFHSGIGPGELPAILRRDESVLTPKQMAQLAPAYAGAGGGGASQQQVNIHNYSGGDVKTRKRQSGNKSVIDVFVGAMGDKMANGSFDAPMQARYGNKIKPITR